MDQYDVITFDCYGTLIDWERGLRMSFLKAIARTGASSSLVNRAVELYEMEERKIESESPHQSYRTVLSKTALNVARRIGWSLQKSEAGFLTEDLPEWTPFADTNRALRRLAKTSRLGILSNIDNDLLAGTLKRLEARFDILVTAENVKSYKPGFAHFEEARRIIGDKRWLHVAGSMYHDIEPALKLGIRAVWVNRKGLPVPDRRVDVVKNLEELSNQLSQS